MIIVRIELYSAVTHRKTEIGKLYIVNDGSGSRRRRNYMVTVMRRRSSCRVTRRGFVKNHSSISVSVWTLVRKALQAAGL